MEKWRDIDKDNIMLCFILEKNEELTEELEEIFKQIFKERFGFKPNRIKLGPPKRHVWVGNWKRKQDD
jgi:hypothetical protein